VETFKSGVREDAEVRLSTERCDWSGFAAYDSDFSLVLVF
jgi:hypothetical protein